MYFLISFLQLFLFLLIILSGAGAIAVLVEKGSAWVLVALPAYVAFVCTFIVYYWFH